MSREVKKSEQRDYKRRWAAAARGLKKRRQKQGEKERFDSDSDGDTDTEIPETPFVDFPETVAENFETNARDSDESYDARNIDESVDSDDDPWIGIDEHVTLSSDSESENERDSLEDRLALWAVGHREKHNAVDSLLKILREVGHPELPSTARTLLSTTRNVEIQIKSGMEYYYFGLKDELLKHFKMYSLQKKTDVNTLQISLNIDGLPLFRSSSTSLWPVLCAIVNMDPIVVFPVVLTCGNSKPSDLTFLSDTIQELNVLLQNGLQCDDRIINVVIRCIVCDAPARAMVKQVKLYSGYSGCDKCSQWGEYIGRVTYQEIYDLDLRTDDTFRRQMVQEHHHKKPSASPFCELPIDMVKAFPIDYMHQVCLGAMKRLLLVWIRGTKKVKISELQKQLISDRLEGMKISFPSTFARKPRSLKEVDRWKATEFRQFLLYSGKFALNGILKPDIYDNFMSLSVAISILVSPKLAAIYRNYAHELLECFVDNARKLYGREFLVYNIHTLLHLADEANEYGSLDACSAFPFENYMHQLKLLVRSGNQPIVQVVKRVSERSSVNELLLNKCSAAPAISVKPPNNAYVLDNKSCCEVISEQKDYYLCRVYEHTEPFFKEPCDSRIVNVFQVHRKNGQMKKLPAAELTNRAIRMDGNNRGLIVFMGLLHEL